MDVITKRIDELIPYVNNPRKNDKAVNAVANSIKQFGFKVPIIIDNNGVIVCGHTRLKAANMLHLSTVPCVVADDLTDDQIKAFRLAENKVSEFSDWDFSKLEQEIAELSDMNIDLSDFGFQNKLNEDQSDNALDLDDTTPLQKKQNYCCCPKCGFEFEV